MGVLTLPPGTGDPNAAFLEQIQAQSPYSPHPSRQQRAMNGPPGFFTGNGVGDSQNPPRPSLLQPLGMPSGPPVLPPLSAKPRLQPLFPSPATTPPDPQAADFWSKVAHLSAVSQARPAAVRPEYAGPAPAMPSLNMSSNAPVLPAPALPNVLDAPNGPEERRIAADLARRNAPYDYHAHGWLRNTGHVLAGIGNVAGDIVSPGTMALVPGTQLHNQMVRHEETERGDHLREQDADLEYKQARLQELNLQRQRQLAQQALDQEQPQPYGAMATGPDGHQIGSNDGGATWYDVQTGEQVQ